MCRLWAAEHDCLLVTHDARTVPRHFYERFGVPGDQCQGSSWFRSRCRVGTALDQLEIVLVALAPGELAGRMIRLPL